MSETEVVNFDMKPRLQCDHIERMYFIKSGKCICPHCDTCFADNGDDIENRLQEFAKKLQDSQQDLPSEFQKVLDDNWQELLA